MQKDKNTNKWTYHYTFKVSAEKRRAIEKCAKENLMTVNRCIKESIDLTLKYMQTKKNNGDSVLKNQLELF
jgi:hypothetical protein